MYVAVARASARNADGICDDVSGIVRTMSDLVILRCRWIVDCTQSLVRV